MNEKDIFNELKDTLKKQLQEEYIAGTREGALVTVSTIYTVLTNIGLEKDNILFDILRDIAQRNGCNNLESYAIKIKEEINNEPRDEYLSWNFIKNMI